MEHLGSIHRLHPSHPIPPKKAECCFLSFAGDSKIWGSTLSPKSIRAGTFFTYPLQKNRTKGWHTHSSSQQLSATVPQCDVHVVFVFLSPLFSVFTTYSAVTNLFPGNELLFDFAQKPSRTRLSKVSSRQSLHKKEEMSSWNKKPLLFFRVFLLRFLLTNLKRFSLFWSRRRHDKLKCGQMIDTKIRNLIWALNSRFCRPQKYLWRIFCQKVQELFGNSWRKLVHPSGGAWNFLILVDFLLLAMNWQLSPFCCWSRCKIHCNCSCLVDKSWWSTITSFMTNLLQPSLRFREQRW